MYTVYTVYTFGISDSHEHFTISHDKFIYYFIFYTFGISDSHERFTISHDKFILLFYTFTQYSLYTRLYRYTVNYTVDIQLIYSWHIKAL